MTSLIDMSMIDVGVTDDGKGVVIRLITWDKDGNEHKSDNVLSLTDAKAFANAIGKVCDGLDRILHSTQDCRCCGNCKRHTESGVCEVAFWTNDAKHLKRKNDDFCSEWEGKQ